ncbi:hypothetical protein OPV22_002763 [Ensete ventricosum]|uniref:Uncharacterized protein n=1 Tax=Ensete ventricosum TaxID=4639 RepID=A0AAV8RYW0_ENSVE|nr:hypothetical protein OPV22_002763 [Ensete ventricosum]
MRAHGRRRHQPSSPRPLVPSRAPGGKKNKRLPGVQEADKVLQGRRRKETWEVCLCNVFRGKERGRNDRPSERKKREISESDPSHALKSISAVTDNDS